MISCSKNEVRRCRPLLGTLVEITAGGLSGDRLTRAVEAAFGAIEEIQRQMSVHNADSELSRLNREAATRPVPVSRPTLRVLRRAGQLAADSDGAFDHTVAPTLARWGLLPKTLTRLRPGTWQDVRLSHAGEVRYLRPLAIDLGGIAKGFAVDAAIAILRRHGVKQAVVNAGGDLRAFGPATATVQVRHPAVPQALGHAIPLHNCALATSAPYFTEKAFRGRRVSHLVNAPAQTAITGAISVTVRARECWLADALTKVVLNAPQAAEALLAKYGAEAFVLTA